MPESVHSLPARYDRLGDQIDGPVLDAIVHPRSRGNLSLPGEYSTDSRPPAHEVKITGTNPDSHSVRTEQHQPVHLTSTLRLITRSELSARLAGLRRANGAGAWVPQLWSAIVGESGV